MSKGVVTFTDAEFRKSSFSKHSKKLCVLVARKKGVVAVRDSKDRRKRTLRFNQAEWRAFIAGVRAGEFDI